MFYSEIDSLFDKTNAFINKQNEYEDLNKIYPVGSIYISTKDTDPSELFGGIWERYAGQRQQEVSTFEFEIRAK